MPVLQSERDIKIDDSSGNLAIVGSHHITISKEMNSALKKSLDENDIDDLYLCRSALQYANQSIQNKDIFIQIAACFAIPLTTHWSFKALGYGLVGVKKTPSFFKQQLFKIATGWSKGIINIMGYKALRRYQVQQADNGLNDDLDSLYGLRSFLQSYIDKEKNRFDTMMASTTTLSQEQCEQVWDAARKTKQDFNFLDNSPTSEKRIAELDKRIVLLKEKQLAQELLGKRS